jgi:hypothetical protein
MNNVHLTHQVAAMNIAISGAGVDNPAAAQHG